MNWLQSRACRLAWILVLVGGAAGCGLLEVNDPTRIEEDELQNAASAELLRYDAVTALAVAAGVGSVASGVFSDELVSDPGPLTVTAGTLTPEWALDRRESELYEPLTDMNTSPYIKWHEARRAASVALAVVRQYEPATVRDVYTGHVFAMRGYATVRLAEDFCPGFPLNDVVGGHIERTPPLGTTAMFERAVADLDSAVALAGDSARFLNFARIGMGRALLGLGRFADAAAAVAGVPTEYRFRAEYSDAIYQLNPFYYDWSPYTARLGVADREGGNGLDFVSTGDPRVTWTPVGTGSDEMSTIYRTDQYPDVNAPIDLANGIEARLIEAEAALHTGGDWRGILNTLRTGPDAPAGLDELDDPGTPSTREDMVFRERAFWLFGTGHRLGDLRRLLAVYGRDAAAVFPAGMYWLGQAYHTATSIAFNPTWESTDNPAITGCTSR